MLRLRSVKLMNAVCRWQKPDQVEYSQFMNEGLASMNTSIEIFHLHKECGFIWMRVCVCAMSKHEQAHSNELECYPANSPSLLTIRQKERERSNEQKKVELSSVFKQWRVYPVKIKFGCSQ